MATQRTALSRARVLDAAVAVADEQGIDALTLRRLAEALEVHPTSIYNHLPSKDAILSGLAERMLEEANLPDHVDTWQEWVRVFASSMRDLARRHPGSFAVLTRRPAQGAAASRHVEAALDAFHRGGFPVSTAWYALSGTALAVMGLAQNETASAGPTPTPVTAHLTAERFPRIAQTLLLAEADPDQMWALIVESLIAGLAAQLEPLDSH